MRFGVGLKAIAACVFVLAGCAGRQEYTPPFPGTLPPNTQNISAPRDLVWNRLVPALSKKFFVINNIDRQSGLINVSYSGDPQGYLDCGRIISYVKNARGERTYDFPGAQAQANYEIMNQNGLFFVDRRMELEGRVNIIVEAISAKETRLSANTRYVLTRKQSISNPSGQSAAFDHTVSFNSGGSGVFPNSGSGPSLTCRSNGKLEAEIVELAN